MSHKRKEYPITDPRFNSYNNTLLRLRPLSQILNSGNLQLSIHTIIWNKKNLQDLFFEYKTKKANLEAKINALNVDFQNYQQKMINQGRHKPEQMRPQMFEDYLRLTAELDVCSEEIDELARRITNYKERETVEDSSKILKSGLKGAGSLKNGVLHEVDGQTVDFVDDVLIITSKQSPYYGLEVALYYDIARKWKIAKSKIDAARLKLAQSLNDLHYQSDRFKSEWATIRNDLFETHSEWKDLFCVDFRGMAIPKWPEGAVNHFDDDSQKEEKKEKKLKRTT